MLHWTRKAKYGSKRTTFEGRRYDSKGEAGLAFGLAMELKAGLIKEIQPQKTFELRGLNGKLVARHRVDFLVTLPDGSQEVREFKGFATEVWRIKRELFLDNYPLIPYIVITAKNRWMKMPRRHNDKPIPHYKSAHR